jgi:LPXTG-site transpeptidase (sortase) family protein
VHPPTEAPPALPGPIYSIDIPRLRLHSGVVPVDWEPPLFVVGQVRTSAYVTEGNSVLVGHVRGAAGYNVFDRLDELAPGDEVVANSRGQAYQFVVTEKQVLPEDDTSPAQMTGAPRLTLMTCTGNWNPLTRDYSDRLWVIAQPASAVPSAEATAVPPPPISGAGALGSTDVDLTGALGAPTGESTSGLTVYAPAAINHAFEHRALLTPAGPGQRRATLVGTIAPSGAPLTFDAAQQISRTMMPRDAQPRTATPEGNQRFAVERFTSASLAATLPLDSFTGSSGTPGDFLVVYRRQPDGHVAFVAVATGDDPDVIFSRFADLR